MYVLFRFCAYAIDEYVCVCNRLWDNFGTPSPDNASILRLWGCGEAVSDDLFPPLPDMCHVNIDTYINREREGDIDMQFHAHGLVLRPSCQSLESKNKWNDACRTQAVHFPGRELMNFNMGFRDEGNPVVIQHWEEKLSPARGGHHWAQFLPKCEKNEKKMLYGEIICRTSFTI